MLHYPADLLVRLEFNKITDLLQSFCKSVLGKKRVSEMTFSVNISVIKNELQQITEYKQIKQAAHYFPLEYLHDLEKPLSILHISNAVLDIESFIKIKQTAHTIDSILRFFKNHQPLYSSLHLITQHIHFEKEIPRCINAVIDVEGNIKDNASAELSKIRSSLSSKRNELAKAFQKILQKLAKDGVLADAGQSVRAGRKVVAVVAESKRKISGILHDESDSGKTVFIEPRETVELNNQIFELERQEEREIYKILQALTAEIATYKTLLLAYQEVLSSFDFIHAKARLSEELSAHAPILSAKRCLHLIKAKHPLLFLYNKKNQKETIPLDLTLHEENRILVISGPNAGGKTVCMKTIGLLQLMVQAGLHVPTDERSEFSVFHSLFIDIGDTQSIEFELSTYSSHLKTMKFFIENADAKTLFFIDELGTGSDPALGGAFAEAIMEELVFKRAFGVVTTHYLNLKIMANRTKGIINGAMIFDEKNLLPTYRLSIGKPGSSYTFAIAERIGLSRILIERAKDLVDEQHVQLDTLLNKLEQEHQLLLEKEKMLSQKTEEIKSNKAEYEMLLKKVQSQQQQLKFKQTNLQSSGFVREAEKKLQKLLQEWETRKDVEIVAKKTAEVIQNISKKTADPPKQTNEDILVVKALPITEIKAGQKVKIISFDQKGIVDSVKGNSITVIVDNMKMKVNASDLTKI